DFLQCISGHVGQLDSGVAEVNVRDSVEIVATAQFDLVPPLYPIKIKKLKLCAGTTRIRNAISIQIHKTQLRVIKSKRRGDGVGNKRSHLVRRNNCQRKVSVESTLCGGEIDLPVNITVCKLSALITQMDSGGQSCERPR